MQMNRHFFRDLPDIIFINGKIYYLFINYNFYNQYITFFLLSGHKVHFIALFVLKNSFMDPSVEKKKCVQYVKNIYFASVKIDPQEKRRQQSNE